MLGIHFSHSCFKKVTIMGSSKEREKISHWGKPGQGQLSWSWFLEMRSDVPGSLGQILWEGKSRSTLSVQGACVVRTRALPWACRDEQRLGNVIPRRVPMLDVRLLGNAPYCFQQTTQGWQQLSESLALKNNRVEKPREQRSSTINGNK